MRKAYVATVTILALIFTSSIFAESNIEKSYYTGKHPKESTKLNAAVSKEKLSTAQFLPLTDITLINATPSNVYVTIPNTTVYDPAYPRVNLHVYNEYQYGDTYLMLKDVYGNAFYSGNVCRRAIVAVYGFPGNYSIYIDREFCNE